jgi:hypothetical protein
MRESGLPFKQELEGFDRAFQKRSCADPEVQGCFCGMRVQHIVSANISSWKRQPVMADAAIHVE